MSPLRLSRNCIFFFLQRPVRFTGQTPSLFGFSVFMKGLWQRSDTPLRRRQVGRVSFHKAQTKWDKSPEESDKLGQVNSRKPKLTVGGERRKEVDFLCQTNTPPKYEGVAGGKRANAGVAALSFSRSGVRCEDTPECVGLSAVSGTFLWASVMTPNGTNEPRSTWVW